MFVKLGAAVVTGAYRPDADHIVYVDRSDVSEQHLDELKAGIRELVAFVDAHQPQMLTYAIYLDEQALEMAVVSVHPDSASLERHIEVGAPEFRKLSPYISLREIEVYGSLSATAIGLVQQKAAALGNAGRVRFHARFAGFDRRPP